MQTEITMEQGITIATEATAERHRTGAHEGQRIRALALAKMAGTTAAGAIGFAMGEGVPMPTDIVLRDYPTLGVLDRRF
jgi:hypothetical protein